MVEEIKAKDEEIEKLKSDNLLISDKLKHFQSLEETLQKAILLAQKTSDQVRLNAYQEAELLIDDAKKTASRITNDALIRAEKTEYEADLLKRNIVVFKRKLKDIIDAQLQTIESIDKTEF
ncbi:MAG: DivIVA domain-containing protein [Bacilli bacterium]|nr:DivIVA domain-containing protein [Bacilli bacterium]